MKNVRLITALTCAALLMPSMAMASHAAAGPEAEGEYILSVSAKDKLSLAQRLENSGVEVLFAYKNFDLIAVRTPVSKASRLSGYLGVKGVQPALRYETAENEEIEDGDEASDSASEEEPADEAAEPEASEDAAAEAEEAETEEEGPYSDGIWTVRQTIESGYNGEGTVAAVIDSAFDVDHFAFVLSDDSTAKFDLDYVGELFDELNASEGSDSVMDLYRSAKIPMAFDYGDMDPDVLKEGEDHGTHVAGIIAGNNKSGRDNGFWGIAPEAQLVLMKVLETEGDGYLSDTAIFAALDDALTLKVDCVNLSLGAVSGFAEEADFEPAYSEVLGKLRSSGINVYYSAGNESSMGPNSLFSYYFGIDDNPTYAPDRSTVGSNATYSDVVAVASAIPDYHSTADHIVTKDGTVIDYAADTNDTFKDAFLGGQYEIAVIPGIGSEEDFEGIDAEGKIALIQRGEITFVDKLYNAEAAGAVGAVIYGNTDDGIYVGMQVEEGQIPAAFILMEDGEYLAENPGKITITHGHYLKEEKLAGMVSDFTSWGPNGMLELKPDVTGYGSDIYSALVGGETGSMSGTSMASPYLTGLSLLMHQMINETGYDVSETDGVTNPADTIDNLIMSSAEVIFDDIGVEYSPRLQGAGLAIADKALSASTEMLDPSTKKAKISLGDKLKNSFSVDFELINLSDEERTYTLAASALTEDFYFDEDAGLSFCMGYEYPLGKAKITCGDDKASYNIYDKSYDAPSVTVPARSSVAITLDIRLSASEMADFKRVYYNGYFIEGYIYATADDSGEISSIPYLGFVGDWSALPMFDHSNRYLDSLLYSDIMGSPYELGWSILDEEMYDERLIAISPNNDGFNDNLWIDFKLLRNAVSCMIYIYAEGGDCVYEGSYDHIPKVYQDDEDGSLVYDQIEIYFGTDTDNEDYVYPDGQYYVNVLVSPEYDRESYQDIALSFIVDTRAPKMTDYSVSEEDGKVYLTVNLSDDRFVHAVELYESYTGDDEEYEPYYETYVFDQGEMGSECEAVFDITGLDADHLYIDIYDEALNEKTELIELS